MTGLEHNLNPFKSLVHVGRHVVPNDKADISVTPLPQPPETILTVPPADSDDRNSPDSRPRKPVRVLIPPGLHGLG